MRVIVKDVTKSYQGISVLNHITFDIENVSSVGIIGESGGGKSTLLRQLAGIETPDTGEIFINGMSPMKEKAAFYERIGYVFQQTNLFPHMSVRKNILLILEKIKKVEKNKAERITEDVLQKLRIENIADKKPHEISGGQAQRASIARALVTDPDLIFLDEPTAALDPLLTEEVLQAVLSLKQEGRSFLFVTHEMEFLKKFADYILFLKDGKIYEEGPVDILNAPNTPELLAFLSHKKLG